MSICRACGAHEDVHEGMCRSCRTMGKGNEAEAARLQHEPDDPSLEPSHDRSHHGRHQGA